MYMIDNNNCDGRKTAPKIDIINHRHPSSSSSRLSEEEEEEDEEPNEVYSLSLLHDTIGKHLKIAIYEYYHRHHNRMK